MVYFELTAYGACFKEPLCSFIHMMSNIIDNRTLDHLYFNYFYIIKFNM